MEINIITILIFFDYNILYLNVEKYNKILSFYTSSSPAHKNIISGEKLLRIEKLKKINMILKKCCILFKIEQFEGVQLYLFSLGYKWINGLNFKLFSNDTVFMHTKKYEHDASYKYIMIDENNGMFSNTNTMRYKYKYIKYVNLLRKDKFKKLL